jgi:hypothetical protein
VLPSDQKLNLGLLAIVTFEVVAFRAYSPFPSLLPFLNTSWKSCSVGVLSTACDSATNISIVSKWRLFSLSSIGKTKKVGWEGDESCCCHQKFPDEKVNVRRYVVVMQQPVFFVAKVRGEVFTHFRAVAVKVTVVCGVDYLECQEEFFLNNPLEVKQNDEHTLNFALTLN